MKWGLFADVIRYTLCACLLLCCGSEFALPQQFPNLAEGQVLYMVHCAKCHGASGDGISAAVTIAGPRIQAVHDPADVMTAMETGPSHMPVFAYVLSVQQMHDVADYVTQKLATIPLSGGELSKGGELYRAYCSTCHRTAGRGGALVFAGTNAPALTHYSPALVAGAIRWGPGAMPSFPPSVLSDQDLASIVEYVKYAQQPPNPGGNTLNWYGPVSEGFVAWLIVFVMVGVVGWIEIRGRG